MARFVWKNGSKVEPAKVTVDGQVYEVQDAQYEGETPLTAGNLNEMISTIYNDMYPVGSIYMSVNDINPSILFGVGTWERWGNGRVPVGVDINQIEFDTVEKTGGEKVHTMTVDELAKHDHMLKDRPMVWDSNQNPVSDSVNWKGGMQYYATEMRTNYTGKSKPFNILQPYITCYMWVRTA